MSDNTPTPNDDETSALEATASTTPTAPIEPTMPTEHSGADTPTEELTATTADLPAAVAAEAAGTTEAAETHGAAENEPLWRRPWLQAVGAGVAVLALLGAGFGIGWAVHPDSNGRGEHSGYSAENRPGHKSDGHGERGAQLQPGPGGQAGRGGSGQAGRGGSGQAGRGENGRWGNGGQTGEDQQDGRGQRGESVAPGGDSSTGSATRPDATGDATQRPKAGATDGDSRGSRDSGTTGTTDEPTASTPTDEA